MSDEAYERGVLTASAKFFESRLGVLEEDVRHIRTTLDQSKGALRVLVGITAVSSAIGAMFASLWHWMRGS